METHLQNDHSCSLCSTQRSERGFSLLEMVIAMVVLSVGLLGVASAIGYALMASNSGRGITNSKMLVVSALEQMETLRNSGQLNFAEISNVQQPGSSFAGFPDDFRRVSTVPGNDGIFGTADDLAGPDGISGNADDIADPALIRQGVTRQILITSLSPLLKRIQVTVRYTTRGAETRDLVGVSYLNDNAHSNYVP